MTQGEKIIHSLQEELEACGGLGTLLREHAERIKAARGAGDADVYRLRTQQGDEVLLKSYLGRCWLMRVMLGRVFLRRELNYLRLFQQEGVGRVPVGYGLLDKDVLVMEFLSGGKSLPKAGRQQPEKSFFVELRAMLRKLHERGLSHGDVRRGNIMCLSTGQPGLIDVATAWHCADGAGWFRRLCFHIQCQSDNFSLARIINSYYPELLDDEQRAALEKAPWYLRLARFYRQRIYRRLRGHH